MTRTRVRTPQEINDLIADYDAHRAAGGTVSDYAAKIGVPRRTLSDWLNGRSRVPVVRDVAQEIQVTASPVTDEPIEAILDRKKQFMRRAKEHDAWAGLIPVQVKETKPICVMAIGDPHVDDNYCDIEQLEADLEVIRRTPGMYAGHLGDVTNSWVGRLQKLYANQSTTFAEGVRLTEWMLEAAPTLFFVLGNHDLWNNGADILGLLTRNLGGVTQAHGVRMALRWPNGEEIRIHARHDFPGDSQFNPVHGLRKETLWGHRDHVLIAGHKHVDGVGMVPSIDGVCHWMLRVSGYKVIDDFAKERNFRPQRAAPSVSLVLDPYSRVEAERVKPFWDHEAAADYLTFLRNRQ
jgi:hypothetical protein